MTNSKSVVIIGGGHNGLVCAVYLAKAGYQVQILEARDSLGGTASTRSFGDGYRVSVAHLHHGLHPKVIKDLNLSDVGLTPGHAVETIALDAEGRHLTLGINTLSGDGLSQRDLQGYAAFKQEFRSYAQALEPLMMNKPPRLKDMDTDDKVTLAKLGWKLRFGLGANSMREFLRVGGINIYDVLNEQFDDERLKGALSVDAIMGQHMGPRTPTTVLTYLHRIWGETFAPQSIPAGGMGQVTTALEQAARDLGVTIRLGVKAKQIIIDDHHAKGVELETGEVIEASLVISNTDAKTTFLRLIDSSELDAMFVHRMSKTRTNGNVAKIHLALNGIPRVKGLSGEQLKNRLLIAPNQRYVEHAFNHAKYGEFSKAPVLDITLPTFADPSLAPHGHHVMSILASFAPYSLKQGWGQGRDSFMKAVMAVLEDYMPGLSRHIVHQELLTPVDIERDYHVAGGHWHHGELAIDQSFMMRPVHGAAQYDTPVQNLFLCGAAAHPGGGVTGVPGHNAAQRIMSLTGEASS